MESLPDVTSLRLSLSDDESDFIVISEDNGSISTEQPQCTTSMQSMVVVNTAEKLKSVVELFEESSAALQRSNLLLRKQLADAGDSVRDEIVQAVSQNEEAAASLRPIEHTLAQMKVNDDANEKQRSLEGQVKKLTEEKQYLLKVNAALNTKMQIFHENLEQAVTDPYDGQEMEGSQYKSLDLSRYLIEIDKLEKKVKQLEEEKKTAMDDSDRKQVELDRANDKLSSAFEEIKKVKFVEQNGQEQNINQLLDTMDDEMNGLKKDRDDLLSTLRIKEEEMKELLSQLEHAKLLLHEREFESTVLVESSPPGQGEVEELRERLQVQVQRREEMEARCEKLEDEKKSFFSNVHLISEPKSKDAPNEESLSTLVEEVTDENEVLRQNIRDIKVEMKEYRDEIRILKDANERLVAEKAVMLEDRHREVVDYDEMEKKMNAAFDEVARYKIQADTFEEDFRVERELRECMAGDLDEIKGKLERTRNMFGGKLPGEYEEPVEQAQAQGNEHGQHCLWPNINPFNS